MKKLMTFAVACVLASAVNAAAITWGFGSDAIEDVTGNYIEGGTAFLFLGTVTASDTAFDFGTSQFVVNGGMDPDTFTFGSPSSPIDSSVVTSTAAGQAYTLILVDRDGLSVTDLASYEGNYILSSGASIENAVPGAGQTTYYGAFTDSTAYAAGDWQTMANVPEPTSGLLLLLGMAGLALKRKNV